MKLRMIAVFSALTFSVSGFGAQTDSATFLKAFPEKYSCQGVQRVLGEDGASVGEVQISIQNKNTDRPLFEITAGKEHFKIGDGFAGSLSKVSDCSYYFSDQPLRMFYVCGRGEADKPLDYLEVTHSEPSSVSQKLICQRGGTSCISLSGCKNIRSSENQQETRIWPRGR